MVLLILLSIFIVLFTAWLLHFYKYERHLKWLPGPPVLPFVGNALELKNIEELLPVLLNFQEQYKGFCKMYIGPTPPAVFTSDIKFVEYILSSTKVLDKANEYAFLSRWLGTGLLTGGSAKWKKHRKIITPAFHFQILQQFIDVFDHYSNILIQKLKTKIDAGSFDIFPFITLCSLDIICATAMGTEVNAQEDSNSKYIHSVNEMCRIIIERSTSPIKRFNSFYYLSKDYKKEKVALEILHGYTKSVIRSRKEQLAKYNDCNNSVGMDDYGVKQRRTFLDLLLQYKKDGESINDEDIREEVDTFMFAGHDTTSSALSFTLYCLAKHPDVQEKVVQELRNIFADSKDRAATYGELQEMKYLEAVIKETLRLYPPVPVYLRNVHEDIEYEGNIIPKNTTLAIFCYGLHRRSDLFPNPDQFDPERFTQAKQPSWSPYAYIPFSTGPRNCIGQKFAMLEMKFIISKVLRNYEIIEVPGHKLFLLSKTVLKSKTGTCIQIKERAF